MAAALEDSPPSVLTSFCEHIWGTGWEKWGAHGAGTGEWEEKPGGWGAGQWAPALLQCDPDSSSVGGGTCVPTLVYVGAPQGHWHVVTQFIKIQGCVLEGSAADLVSGHSLFMPRAAVSLGLWFALFF